MIPQSDASENPFDGSHESTEKTPAMGVEAEYTLETDARCPACGKLLETVEVVRVLRTKVNFVSSLPRRGQLLVCGECSTILAGSLGGLI